MARQKKLPGLVKDDSIEEIEVAAETYSKAASRSQSARKKTAETRDSLIGLLEKHGRENYKAENGKVYAVGAGKKKIVVTDPNEESAGDEDEDEDVEARVDVQ